MPSTAARRSTSVRSRRAHTEEVEIVSLTNPREGEERGIRARSPRLLGSWPRSSTAPLGRAQAQRLGRVEPDDAVRIHEPGDDAIGHVARPKPAKHARRGCANDRVVVIEFGRERLARGPVSGASAMNPTACTASNLTRAFSSRMAAISRSSTTSRRRAAAAEERSGLERRLRPALGRR